MAFQAANPITCLCGQSSPCAL